MLKVQIFEEPKPHRGQLNEIDYVKKTRLDSNMRQRHSLQLKELLENIKHDKKYEGELLKRHNPKDGEISNNGLISPSSSTKNVHGRAKPKIDTRNVLYKQHFFEN